MAKGIDPIMKTISALGVLFLLLSPVSALESLTVYEAVEKDSISEVERAINIR